MWHVSSRSSVATVRTAIHLLLTDVWKILESMLILPNCWNLEILFFLPLRWRYFLITIPSCIYGNVHQRAQSWPVGLLGFKNSCMLILIFLHVCSFAIFQQIIIMQQSTKFTETYAICTDWYIVQWINHSVMKSRLHKRQRFIIPV